MQVKTKDLEGAALNWAVAKAMGCELTTRHALYREIAEYSGQGQNSIASVLAKLGPDEPCIVDSTGRPVLIPDYSSSWAQGGPIIEREGMELHLRADQVEGWSAFADFQVYGVGPTPLIAAMRCFVAKRLGYSVDIPDELMGDC